MWTEADVYRNWSIVFVEPRYSLNVGYVARITANFGFKELVLVYPKIKIGYAKIRSKEAAKYAAHGRYLLERARVVKSLRDIRRKKSVLIATTAITGKGYERGISCLRRFGI
jgi:tRNA/rRNA methyltransferase